MTEPLMFHGAAGPIYGEHRTDAKGNPAGGHINGKGFQINWQDGPLGRGEDRIPANGAFVEDVVLAVIERMRFYQSTKFGCRENALVITKLEEAVHWMNHRTADRERRGVEGTHKTMIGWVDPTAPGRLRQSAAKGAELQQAIESLCKVNRDMADLEDQIVEARKAVSATVEWQTYENLHHQMQELQNAKSEFTSTARQLYTEAMR